MSIQSVPIENKNPIDYNPIYKVNILVDGVIDSVYIFYGTDVQQKNEEEIKATIFTQPERENIKHTYFSKQQIHRDDTIGVIKLKILSELKKKVPLGEIYLFCKKFEYLNSIAIFQLLTQNKKIKLTRQRLEQFLSNIDNTNKDAFIEPEQKDEYDLNDILSMKLDGKKLVNKVLGQKFFIMENEYPFVCDPYKVTDYDPLLVKISQNSISTLNNNLLLNTGEIEKDNIYVCLASDVLPNIIHKDLSESTTLKIYYPFLYSKNIKSLEQLASSEDKLIDEDKDFLDKKTFESFKTIDMFYDIYKHKKTDLPYLKKGIKFIKAIIKPNFIVKIPLDVIFKVIHSTQSNPLVKYNPSSRQENIYRLYTDQIAADGRKMPYLKKAVIFNLMKNIGKTKSVTVFIEFKNGSNDQAVYCEFNENGYITISSEFIDVVSESEIDEIFRNTVNPIIDEVKKFLEQSGYKLDSFNSLSDENIEVKQINYETQIEISKQFNIETYKGCIYSIFNNESSKKKDDMTLRFKRVANFNKVTNQEAFILQKQEEGFRGKEIIDALLDNFKDDLTREQAIELLKKVANEIELESGIKKTDIKIKDNPGFKTTILFDKKNRVLTITVENINDINYLLTIPIYLDTIIRLTQDKNSTDYPAKEIKKLCSKDNIGDAGLPDINTKKKAVSSIEENDENEDDITIKYKNDKKEKALEMALFGIDFDEDFFGGEGTSSSDSSIASEVGDQGAPIIIEKPKEAVSSEKSDSVSPMASLKDSDSSIASEGDLGSLVPSLEDIGESSVSEKGDLDAPIIIEKTKEVVLAAPPAKLPEEAVKEVVAPAKSSEEAVKEVVVAPPVIQAEEQKPPAVTKEKPNTKFRVESSSESSAESGSDSEQEEKNIEKNLDGMSLRNYFQDKIEKYDAPLIIKKEVGNYSTYSKICQSQFKRQPVILTDDELAKINQEHDNFLRDDDIIKYGSDKNNQFNYICPRYWCLKTNSPINPKDFKKEMENGKEVLVHPTCGKILPADRKSKDDKIIPGHYVYEFYKTDEKNPKYKRYPGFQTDKHPKGYCLPCCFDKYNTVGRMEAKAKCQAPSSKDADNDDNADKDKKVKDKKDKKDKNEVKKDKDKEEEEEEDEYVKGPEKFPLSIGRWGYLPVPIQKILHEVNADCQVSKTNTNIKQDHPCLLRHGVEISEKQSFVACISDAVFYVTEKVPSIDKMRERIIKSLKIDNFIKYQNGNLVTDFYDRNKEIDVSNLNEKYTKNVKLYSKLKMNVEADKLFYSKVISAFENFITFLNDNDAVIDHTYLWDLVCMPNKYIFEEGINLVIFEIPNDDITNNVQMICPSNHYSTEFYDPNKETLFLLKEGNYYEPIYSYTNSKKLFVKKTFKEKYASSTMKAVFNKIVEPLLNKICKPERSMPPGGLPPPKVYESKTPLLLNNLLDKIYKYKAYKKNKGYKVLKLIVNFHNKVIGVLVENPSNIKGFVPCYPSNIETNFKNEEIEYGMMTDLDIWNTYDKTIEFLKDLKARSIKKILDEDKQKLSMIPCAPAFKIIEDNMIVGILTETNQFIQLSEPIAKDQINPKNNIPSFKNFMINPTSYIVDPNARPMVQSDVIISTSNKVDEERVNYVKKIKAETNFYNVFRNTIRILLNDYKNHDLKMSIESELSKDFLTYSQKLEKITNIFLGDDFKELIDDTFLFNGNDNYYKLVDEVSTCIVKDQDSCTKQSNLCAVTDKGKCRLILPEKSLVALDKTTKDYKLNKPIYFQKMADELIRYNRIKPFMFEPQTYLSFGNIGYNLRDNEIIMLQSLLTQDYFENIVPVVINKYVKHISYDEAEPIITQPYDNVVPSLNEAIGIENTNECQTIKKKISSGKWNECFPENFKEIQYNKTNYCTFMFIIYLIEKRLAREFSVNEIKQILYEEYNKYLEEFEYQIIDNLISEGKQIFGRQVMNHELKFIDFINTDNYFLTIFDIWLLVQKFQIPTIFISTTKSLETYNKELFFIGYGQENDNFAFIVVPGIIADIAPKFKLIETDNNDVFIPLNKLLACENKNKISSDSFRNKIIIADFLRDFYKKKNEKKIEKKKKKIRSEKDGEEPVKNQKKTKVNIRISELVSPVIEPKDDASPEFVINKKDKTKKVELAGTKKQTNKTKKNKKE